jgi:hypothetical protein
MQVFPDFLILIFFACGIVFFGWLLIWKPLITGSAGYSGISIERNSNPIKFWLTVLSNIAGITFVAVIMFLAFLKG